MATKKRAGNKGKAAVAPKGKAKSAPGGAAKAKARPKSGSARTSKATPTSRAAKAGKAKPPVAPKAKGKPAAAPKGKATGKTGSARTAKAKPGTAATPQGKPKPVRATQAKAKAVASPRGRGKTQTAAPQGAGAPSTAPGMPRTALGGKGAKAAAAPAGKAKRVASPATTASSPQARPAWMAAYEGRIVRHHLMSTDVVRSKAFYGELFGWVFRDLPELGVTRISVAGRRLGAMRAVDSAGGYGSHWVPYPCVADVDHTCAEVLRRGGTVCLPATDLGIGRFAVCEFPPRARFSPFMPHEAPALPEGPVPVGAFCWDELITPDVPTARAFYAGLFGWDTVQVPMPGLDYVMCMRANRQVAGLMKGPPTAPAAASWLAYVAADDVDAAAAHAEHLGACVLVHPQDIPGVGRFSVLLDPTGASIAVFRGGEV